MGLLFSLLNDRLTCVAHGRDRAAFVAAFPDIEVWILSLPTGFSLDSDPTTSEELLAMVEATVKDLDERQTGFHPFTYFEGDINILPIFSSQRYAESFIGEFVGRIDRIMPFQMLSTIGRYIIPAMQCADRVILNDSSKVQVEIADRDIALLCGS